MKRRTLTLARTDDDASNDERTYQVTVVDDDGDLRATVEGQGVQIVRDPDERFRLTSDRTVTAWAVADGASRWVFVEGSVYQLSEIRPEERTRSRSQHGSLAPPMPATVRRVLVKPGDAVRPGDTLVILEAMKMELPIRAGGTGIVSSVNCREGELVQPGVPLLDIQVADLP